MTAYDEARAAGLAALHADSEWHYSDGTGAWRANYGRAVDLILAAALPHLTDDGAGSGEPAVAAGEAGSIPAGNPAPSSPHLTASRAQMIEVLGGSELAAATVDRLLSSGVIRDAGPIMPDSFHCDHAETKQDDYGATQGTHCGQVFA